MINVEDYNPNWPQQFQAIKEILMLMAGKYIETIEHVGSTSVPGLAAKPILDVDIIVKDEATLHQALPMLRAIGYNFAGDMDVKDRYAFHSRSNLSPNTGEGTVWPAHNLYCCIAGSLALKNHLSFRDALRNAPELALEYGELKKKIALKTTDIDTYVSLKSPFIAKVLDIAGFSSDQIKETIEQNEVKFTFNIFNG